ncbi:MAG: flagellar basal body-associated FliL family protein [Pseudomonadota bacterium]
MTFPRISAALIVSLCVFGLAIQSPNASAESGGDGGYIKIEPFTVNLLGGVQYLQMSMRIRGGSPEVAGSVSSRMPMVRHELILLLSGQKSADILSVKGKIVLLEDIKMAINKAIEMKGQNGVTEVALESFVVQ